jgi:hypothetical protein
MPYGPIPYIFYTCCWKSKVTADLETTRNLPIVSYNILFLGKVKYFFHIYLELGISSLAIRIDMYA